MLLQEGFKKCNKCKEIRSFSEFNIDRRSRGGYRYTCKYCESLSKKTPQSIYTRYKYDASRRNIEFNISKKDFLKLAEQNKCTYCNSELKQIRLDRINNERGYILDNVTPCCQVCNFMKRTMDAETFLDIIKKIYLHQEDIKNVE